MTRMRGSRSGLLHKQRAFSKRLSFSPGGLVGETPVQFGQGLGEQRPDLWALLRGHLLSQERAGVPEVREYTLSPSRRTDEKEDHEEVGAVEGDAEKSG